MYFGFRIIPLLGVAGINQLGIMLLQGKQLVRHRTHQFIYVVLGTTLHQNKPLHQRGSIFAAEALIVLAV